MSSNFDFQCPHCGISIANPRKICPNCREDISAELKEYNLTGWIDFPICAAPTALIMWIFYKFGVTLPFLGKLQPIGVLLVFFVIFCTFKFIIFRDILKRIRSKFE